MKTRRPLAKLTALILSLAMTLTLLTGMTTAPGQKDYCAHVCGDGTCLYAQGMDCDENDDEEYVHVHDADCGYIEPVSCDHVCGEDCAEIPPGLTDDEPGGESSDIIDDETTPEQDDCAHICGEGLCAFDEDAGIDCDHVCDDDCGDSSGLTDDMPAPMTLMGIMPLSGTTHTWSGSTPPAGLADGDEVVLATGVSGTLTVPANATITIVGGTSSTAIEGGFGATLTFNIPATSKVVWEAYYQSIGADHTIELSSSGGGTFEVANGLIKNPTSDNITIFAYSGNVFVFGGSVEAAHANTGTAIQSSAWGIVFINYGATVVGWNEVWGSNIDIRRTGNATTYTQGTSDELTFTGTDATATWDVVDGKSGISYARNDNTGFFEVPGVTVVPPQTFTVSFNSNGGAPEPTPTTVTHGGTITAPTTPTKGGFAFGGWYADENLTTPWNFATDTVTEDITLYARWTLTSVILGGDAASGDLLEVTINNTGGVIPRAWNNDAWQRLYYSTTNGSSLWLHHLNVRLFAIGDLQQTITLGDKVVDTDGTESITRTWLSAGTFTSGVELIETFRLEKGADFYTRTMKITNNSGDTLEDVRLHLGGDTWFGSPDNSYGGINTDTGAAFLYRNVGEIIMSLRGITAPTNYYAAHYTAGNTAASTGNNLSNTAATGGLVDTGYYLQWGGANAISIPNGGSYTIETSEQFTTRQELTWSAGAGTGSLQSVEIDNVDNKISVTCYAHEGVTVAELTAGLAYTLPFNPTFVVTDDNNAVMDGNAPLENADGGTVQIREDAVLALRTYDLEVTVIELSAAFSGNITGFTGIALADTQYINVHMIAGDTFAETLSGNWITNLPAGLSQSVARTSATTAVITVTGTPTVASTAPIEVTIPAGSLATFGNTALTPEGGAGSVYNIQAPTYWKDTSPSSHTFTAASYGYGVQSAQTFTITNTGNQPLTALNVWLRGDAASAFEISTALSSGSIAVGGSATISIRPKANLAASATVYTDDLMITHDNAVGDQVIPLRFTVNQATVQSITTLIPDVTTGITAYTARNATTAQAIAALAGLPATVNVTTTGGNATLPITWNVLPSFTHQPAGATYTFTGTLTGNSNINVGSVTATVNVTVTPTVAANPTFAQTFVLVNSETAAMASDLGTSVLPISGQITVGDVNVPYTINWGAETLDRTTVGESTTFSGTISYTSPPNWLTLPTPLSVSRVVTVTDKIPVTVSGVTVTGRAYNGSPIAMTGTPVFTTDSGMAWLMATYAWADSDGAALPSAPTNVGSYTLTVSADGGTEYEITPLVIHFEIVKANQTISFPQPGINRVGRTETLTATASSGLAVTLTSSDTSLATISGNVLNLIAEGTVTITATQAGNDNYNAATAVTRNITILPEASDDAALSNLTVSAGTLTPAFSAATTSYTVAVANNVSSISITATPSHADATVSGAGTRSLAVGANTITVTVTAEDGTTTRAYTITVTRAAPQNQNGGNNQVGSGGSSSSGSGIIGAITSLFTPQEQWKTPSMADTLMRDASGQEFTRSRHSGIYGVRAAAWENLAGKRFEHDTMDGNSVQVRVVITNPTEFTTDTLVSGYVKGRDVDRTNNLFTRFFDNNVQSVAFDQQGDWEQPVRIAAKVDLAGMDADNLVFYSYDREANTYRRIANPAYRIDANGYLWFNTPYAGTIVISDGALARR